MKQEIDRTNRPITTGSRPIITPERAKDLINAKLAEGEMIIPKGIPHRDW